MAKIVIIGGGVAGISAGIYARLLGHEAIVCESHFIPGGNLTGWDREGYHIDNCIHWLTGTNPVTSTYKMWEDLGVLGDIEVIQGDALYVCEHNGETLGLYCDIDRIERRMLEISPADKREIKQFVRAVKLLQEASNIAGADHKDGPSFSSLFALPLISKYYNLTTGELASRFTHPLLKSFISAFWGNDFGAFSLIFVVAHYAGMNAGLPRGGSTAMAERMVARLKALGGELLLRKEAVKINYKDGKAESVTFKDGDTVFADYFILTPDPASVFGTILDIPMPKELKRQYDDERMRRFSSYHCALACDMAALPFSGDFIFEVPKHLRDRLGMHSPGITSVIVREFSHEPTFSPDGKNLLQTMIFCYEDDAKKFISLRESDEEAYNERKREMSDILVELIVSHFPEMQGKLRPIDFWTPATYRRYTKSEIGSYMSFALPSKLVPTRKSNRIKDFDNVILATQWIQAPGGLPIAAELGKLAAEEIAKMERRSK